MQRPPLSRLALLLVTTGAVLQADTLRAHRSHQLSFSFLEDGVQPPSIPPEPLCLVTLRGVGNNSRAPLSVVGGLDSYEHAFLEAVQESHWGPQDLATFGVCSFDAQATLPVLQRLGASLGEPGGQQVLTDNGQQPSFDHIYAIGNKAIHYKKELAMKGILLSCPIKTAPVLEPRLDWKTSKSKSIALSSPRGT
ncbi:hypothetical protein STEG23_017445 [Scotinomys teguina]